MKVNYNYLEQEFSKPNQIIKEWRKLIKSTDFTLENMLQNLKILSQNLLDPNIVFQQTMEQML